MKRERPGEPLAVGEVTITPVERVSIDGQRLGDTMLFSGAKRPVAVIVRIGEREWRLPLPGAPRDIPAREG